MQDLLEFVLRLQKDVVDGETSNTFPIEEGEGNVEDEEPIKKEVLTESFSGPTDITFFEF